MRLSLLLLFLGVSALRADNVDPTITQTITTTGTGFGQANAFATLASTSVNAGVNVTAETFPPGGSASALINLQAEYVAVGTGAAVLSFTGEGDADGSIASAELTYQLNDMTGRCFIEECQGGIATGGGSEVIQLGVPFYFSLTGDAQAGYIAGGNTGEGAGGMLRLNFDVTQNGVPVELTEVALLTPEPATIGLGAIGFVMLTCALQFRRRGYNSGVPGCSPTVSAEPTN